VAGKSPKFMYALIALGVSTLLTIAFSIVFGVVGGTYLTDFMAGITDMPPEIANELRTVLSGSMVFSILPGVLIGSLPALGFFLFWLACKKNDTSTRILTINMVFHYISMITVPIAVGLFCIIFIIIGILTISELLVMGIIFLIIGAIFVVPAIIYWSNAIKAIKNVHLTLADGLPRKFPSFLIIMNWILVVMYGISAISSFTLIVEMPWLILTILSAAANALFIAIITMCISDYNKSHGFLS
jgi:uncharacterized protein YneF (UPF0154 family)